MFAKNLSLSLQKRDIFAQYFKRARAHPDSWQKSPQSAARKDEVVSWRSDIYGGQSDSWVRGKNREPLGRDCYASKDILSGKKLLN